MVGETHFLRKEIGISEKQFKEESSDESTIISSQTSTLTRNQGDFFVNLIYKFVIIYYYLIIYLFIL